MRFDPIEGSECHRAERHDHAGVDQRHLGAQPRRAMAKLGRRRRTIDPGIRTWIAEHGVGDKHFVARQASK
jgi:hypothetical protein